MPLTQMPPGLMLDMPPLSAKPYFLKSPSVPSCMPRLLSSHSSKEGKWPSCNCRFLMPCCIR